MTAPPTPPPEPVPPSPADAMRLEIAWSDKAVMLITAAAFVAGFAIEGDRAKMVAQLGTVAELCAAWATHLTSQDNEPAKDN